MERAPILWAICFALVISIPATGLTQDVEVTSAWVKWTRRGMDKYSFEAEIRVRNDTDTTRKVLGTFIFYDRRGLAVERATFSGKVEARGSADLIIKGTLPIRVYEKISSHEAAIIHEYPVRW